jgi:hypothetical protein
VIHRFADALIRELEGKATALAEEIGRGAAADWPDYQRRVGMVRGLDEAVKAVKALRAKQEDFDEEDHEF